MNNFQPPPTHTLPILVDDKTKIAQFNPIWLRWFLDLVNWFNSSGGTTFDGSVTVIANEVYGQKQTDNTRRLRSDAQIILANQVFGD